MNADILKPAFVNCYGIGTRVSASKFSARFALFCDLWNFWFTPLIVDQRPWHCWWHEVLSLGNSVRGWARRCPLRCSCVFLALIPYLVISPKTICLFLPRHMAAGLLIPVVAATDHIGRWTVLTPVRDWRIFQGIRNYGFLCPKLCVHG